MSVPILPLATDVSWATPLAAVGGALLVAILNSRQQRAQHFREKMLDAADAFQASMQAASEALLRLARDSEKSDDATEWLRRAQRALDEATLELARLNLLFGPDSKTSRWAIEAHLRLDTTARWVVPEFIDLITQNMEHPNWDEDDEIEAAREHLHGLRELADEQMRDFARSAFKAMRSPGRLRTVDRIREPLRMRVWWPIRRLWTAVERRLKGPQYTQEADDMELEAPDKSRP